MSVRGNFCSEKCHSRNCPSGKCTFGELSVRGTVLRETLGKLKDSHETILIYSIRRSGLRYRIKGLSGYFHIKRKPNSKLT